MPWLSVLIPVYRVEKYLEACVRSVIDQGSEGVEIVLLDDGSPDRSGEIAAGLQSRHPGVIRLLAHPHNRGLSSARNSLLAAARGEYVWFLDSDDELLPGAIGALQRIVALDGPDLVLCDFRVLRERSGFLHRLRGETTRSSVTAKGMVLSADRSLLVQGLLESRQLHAWSKIAKRDVWRQARFPDDRSFQDMAVIPALAAATGTWRRAPYPWVAYRQRDDSIQADMTLAKAYDALASVRDLHAGLTIQPGLLDRKGAAALDYFCLRMFATLARRLPRSAALDAASTETMAAVLPSGPNRAIRECRARGWWLRAWRAERSLSRRGWL